MFAHSDQQAIDRIQNHMVSVVVLRQNHKKFQTLLLRRTEYLAGAWCVVVGKIKPGEKAYQAALRELKEETGLKPVSFYSADFCEIFYEHTQDIININPVFVAFVDNNQTVKINHEHDRSEWLSLEQVFNRVPFAGQRRMFSHIKEAFVERQPSQYLKINLKV